MLLFSMTRYIYASVLGVGGEKMSLLIALMYCEPSKEESFRLLMGNMAVLV